MYYLGTITAASGGYYNNQTGQSGIGTFTIPGSVKAVYLQSSSTGMQWALSNATGITAFINAGNGGNLGGPNSVNGRFLTVGENVTVGIWNALGGFVSVRIWAAPITV